MRVFVCGQSPLTFLEGDSRYFAAFDEVDQLSRMQSVLHSDHRMAQWMPKLVPRRSHTQPTHTRRPTHTERGKGTLASTALMGGLCVRRISIAHCTVSLVRCVCQSERGGVLEELSAADSSTAHSRHPTVLAWQQ